MILSELGENIKKIRKERGYTQVELSATAGISRATLSKLENGYIGNISIAMLDNILGILGYQIDIKLNNPFMS
jgi:transcriptional regulator with XRE-family HTH domain